MKLKEVVHKIDRKALAKAVGLMCLSWAALPIVYYLLVRKKKKGGEEDDGNKSVLPYSNEETEGSTKGERRSIR